MHSHTTLQYNHYGTTVGTSETKRLRSTQIHTNKEYNKRSPFTPTPQAVNFSRARNELRAGSVPLMSMPSSSPSSSSVLPRFALLFISNGLPSYRSPSVSEHVRATLCPVPQRPAFTATTHLCVRHEEVLHPRGLELRVVACQPWCFDHPSGNHLTVVVRVLIDHKGEIELLGNRLTAQQSLSDSHRSAHGVCVCVGAAQLDTHLHQVRKGCAWGALKRPGRPRAHNARLIAPKRFDVAKYPFVLRILKVVLHLAIASREDLGRGASQSVSEPRSTQSQVDRP